MLSTRSFLSVLACLAAATAAHAVEGPHARLQAVPFTRVRLNDVFWAPRIEINRTVSVPHTIRQCEETGRIDNFAKAGRLMPGDFKGTYFDDSDVYKVIEGAAYALAHHPDPELEARVDAIIDRIAAAQQPDGYLMTYYILTGLDKRWTDLKVMHELYCAGHLFEAAVAYHQATGKDKLLQVARRLADHIDGIFGPPPKRLGWCGHQEIELALIKLWRATGEERYRRLAEWFVEVRGSTRDPEQTFCQAHLPVVEQSEITGHAVRAMYYYSAVADVAALTGNRDYIAAMERLWHNVTGRKMYLTGGIGVQGYGEGFAADYDLPNDAAYAETCASIGMVLWNHRLFLLHGDGKYADIAERALYNGMLSGVSLSGDRFFYVNPLASHGLHHRKPWYGTACCPSNMVRILPSVPGYVYATDAQGIWVNLYAAGTARIPLAGREIVVEQTTRYPWEGTVALRLTPPEPAEFAVHLRIPGWCRAYAIRVNGEALQNPAVERGFVHIRRSWKAGDGIDLELSMPVERIECIPRVAANQGRVALQRGPLVYCLEGVDNDHRVRQMALPRDAELTATFEPEMLQGVVTIQGPALAAPAADWYDRLYRPAVPPTPVRFKAVPYYAWDNRDPGPMIVWIPEAIGLAEAPLTPSLAAGARVTASHCFDRDVREAVNDGVIPRKSADHGVPRFTWYPRRGGREWIEYSFEKPLLVSEVEVYWFDDRPNGICRLPRSWRLLWKNGEQWEPVRDLTGYPIAADEWNRVGFEPVTTTGLRIEVEMQENLSAGILEWRVR